jgi:hypothetical protein
VTKGFRSCAAASAVARVRRSNEPIPRSGERSAEIVERYRTPGELAVRRRIVRLVRTAIPRGPGGPKRQAAVGRGGRRRDQSERQVEQEHALEGRTPRRNRRPESLVVSATARTRHGNKALKPATRALAALRGGGDAAR